MSLVLTNKLDILKDRARMLARCRSFFDARGVLEVDVPILSRTASVDVHIDLIQAMCCKEIAYMHSSPEYGMKRLLAEGSGDIYQISHVFRDHEKGERHTPEFVMAEWYRLGFTLPQMLDETLQFIRLFLSDVPMQYETFTYKEAFMQFVGRYPLDAEERDALYAFEIEPNFSKSLLTVITDFPAEQAALSQIAENGLAERFEVYYQGMELANGYHELHDAVEQEERIEQANRERRKLGKDALPRDDAFIEALKSGMPDCCGVAVGFDRLMMLRHQLSEIRDASSFFI